MSISTQLERQLPLLRRYTRAALRDAELADRCLALAIEQLIRAYDQNEIKPDDDLGARMYYLIEEAIRANTDENFHTLAFRAIVLVRMEELSPEETAKILGIKIDMVERFLSVL